MLAADDDSERISAPDLKSHQANIAAWDNWFFPFLARVISAALAVNFKARPRRAAWPYPFDAGPQESARCGGQSQLFRRAVDHAAIDRALAARCAGGAPGRDSTSGSSVTSWRLEVMARYFLWISFALTGFVTSACWAETQHAGGNHAAACETLANTDFTGIDDAPTRITSARLVEPEKRKDADAAGAPLDDSVQGLPTYCRVQGYIWPQVGFELRLPLTGWNGKFIEIGCGGPCGNLNWTFWCPTHRGYACIVSDMGHRGGREFMSFWHNTQVQADFGFRATHVTALAGKAIVESYYGKMPSKSLMFGCSTGGYQGMVEAQRFPWDFDGIVAIARDAESEQDTAMRANWHARNLIDQNGDPIFSPLELARLHKKNAISQMALRTVSSAIRSDADLIPRSSLAARGKPPIA